MRVVGGGKECGAKKRSINRMRAYRYVGMYKGAVNQEAAQVYITSQKPKEVLVEQ